MIDIWCPGHGRRVLVSWGNVQGLENRDDGMHLRVRCWCGEQVEEHFHRSPVTA